jgi:hypothetical protein
VRTLLLLCLSLLTIPAQAEWLQLDITVAGRW